VSSTEATASVHDNPLVAEYNGTSGKREAQRKAAENEWRSALANPSSLVFVAARANVTEEEVRQITEHNRALCDQTITIAGLTPDGLALPAPSTCADKLWEFLAMNS
jgi:hypothetical protein